MREKVGLIAIFMKIKKATHRSECPFHKEYLSWILYHIGNANKMVMSVTVRKLRMNKLAKIALFILLIEWLGLAIGVVTYGF